MPAERRRAAALDRRHYLQLVEADVTGVGSAPRRPVIAEDIRDLQLRTEHCRGRLRRRLIFRAAPVSFTGPLLWTRQLVERALDGGDHSSGDVGIARCGFWFSVTQQRLDGSDMGLAFE
jgi:hypothetical protein